MEGPALRPSWRAVAIGAAVVIGVAAAWWLGIDMLRRRDLGSAIATYNATLAEAVRTLDPRKVDALVGPQEELRVRMYVGKLTIEGTRLDSRLEDLDVLSVRIRGVTATVLTRETWRYVTVRRGATATAEGVTRERYRMRYTMSRGTGRWLVDLSEIVSREEIAGP